MKPKRVRRSVKSRAVAKGIALAVGFSLAAPASYGASILSLFNSGGGANSASDEDRAYLIDRDAGPVGQLDVGDSIRAMANFNTLNSGVANVGGTTGNNEWSVVAQIQVQSKTLVAPGLFAYDFGPDPAFAASLCGGVASCTNAFATGFAPGTGAMAVFFEDATPNFVGDFDDTFITPALAALADDGTAHAAPHQPAAGAGHPGDGVTPPDSGDVSTGAKATEEAFIETAYDGTHFWTLGFLGDGAGTTDAFGSLLAGSGEGWSIALDATGGLSGDNFLSLFGLTSTGSFNSANFSINRVSAAGSAGGVALAPSQSFFTAAAGNVGCLAAPATCGMTEFNGSITARGVSDLDTAFEETSNLQVGFNTIAVVPEPSAITLLAIGLLGMGASSRRRNKNVA